MEKAQKVDFKDPELNTHLIEEMLAEIPEKDLQQNEYVKLIERMREMKIKEGKKEEQPSPEELEKVVADFLKE